MSRCVALNGYAAQCRKEARYPTPRVPWEKPSFCAHHYRQEDRIKMQHWREAREKAIRDGKYRDETEIKMRAAIHALDEMLQRHDRVMAIRRPRRKKKARTKR